MPQAHAFTKVATHVTNRLDDVTHHDHGLLHAHVALMFLLSQPQLRPFDISEVLLK